MQDRAPDGRARTDRDILEGLAARDAVALADACARTLPAATAVCRRILPAADREPTLEAAYRRLWSAPPPPDTALEGWVRAQCFGLGVERLRARGAAPVAASVVLAAPDLPTPPGAGYRDASERALDALDDAARGATVRAHDAGVPSTSQEEPDAPDALLRGLLALAGRDGSPPEVDRRAGDLILGLLGADEAAAVSASLRALGRAEAADLLRALLRGRRRLEGEAPAPPVGLRIIARLLAAPPTPTTVTPGSADRPLPAPPEAVPDTDPAPAPAPDAPADLEPHTPDPEPLPGGRTAEADGATRGRSAYPAVRWLGAVLLVLAGVALGLFVVGPLLLDLLGRLAD